MFSEKSENLLKNYGLQLMPTKIKPWGFTIGIHPNSIHKFINLFFPESMVNEDQVSPRFIIVNPKSRLSWQKHERRMELWKIVKGPVGVMLSQTDKEPKSPEIKNTNSIIKIGPQTRHRIVGLTEPAIVAEIWIHTNENNPSDANDITRLDDDYER
jgi:mannose-6-phosphate isomerase-like protein (cupin superfamily)